MRAAQDPADGNDAAARLLQQLSRPPIVPIDGWDPTPLEVACRTMSRNQTIRRIHSVLPCPERAGGALPVVEYAETLGFQYQVLVHCTLTGSKIRVTFERPDPTE